MKPTDLSRSYEEKYRRINHLASVKSPWQDEAKRLAIHLRRRTAKMDDILFHCHKAQRLLMVDDAGLLHDKALYCKLYGIDAPDWRDYESPPATISMQKALAEKLYNAKPNEKLVINAGLLSRKVLPHVVEKAVADNVDFDIQFDDAPWKNAILKAATEEQAAKLGKAYAAPKMTADKSITIAANISKGEKIKPDAKNLKAFKKAFEPVSERARSGELFFTLTRIPTKRDARIDKIPYKEYTTLFFEMCDQPWTHLDAAQKELIKELNSGKKLRFTNDDGTDLSMDIKGYTFANSLIAKNVPGSEVFSAPRRDSTNGIIIAKGRFMPKDTGGVVEDITLKFKDGKLIHYTAKKGLEHLKKALEVDDGAKFIGEIGIGTNPHLRQHVANTLLVEKIGGSFHVALGAAYSLTEYEGEPVKLDNGNKSALHWDITTMLQGKNGRIYLDDKLIMDNGKFLDAKYRVFNEGWKAVEESKRPLYWQKKLAKADKVKEKANKPEL